MEEGKDRGLGVRCLALTYVLCDFGQVISLTQLSLLNLSELLCL